MEFIQSILCSLDRKTDWNIRDWKRTAVYSHSCIPSQCLLIWSFHMHFSDKNSCRLYQHDWQHNNNINIHNHSCLKQHCGRWKWSKQRRRSATKNTQRMLWWGKHVPTAQMQCYRLPGGTAGYVWWVWGFPESTFGAFIPEISSVEICCQPFCLYGFAFLRATVMNKM